MIKTIYLVLNGFKNKKIINVLMIIQVFITIVTSNLLIGTLQQSNYILKVTNDSELSKALYFSALPRIINSRNDSSDLINNEIAQLSQVKAIGKSLYTYATMPEINTLVDFYIYNNDLINSFKLPLLKGKWYNNNFTDNEIPIIISKAINSKYKIGDTILVTSRDKYSKKVNVQFKVTGVFDNSNFMLKLGAGGEQLGLNSIFQKNKYFAVIPDGSYLKRMEVFDDYGRVLFLNNTSDEACNEVITQLKDIGSVNKISDMTNIYKSRNEEQVLKEFVMCLILLVLALTGIGGNNILMQIFNEKEFAVYFTCGMRWNECVLITFINNIILLILPTTAGYLLLTKSNWHILDQMIINSNNFIFTISIMLLIFVITSVQPLYRLYKTEPITVIRRWS